MHLEYKKLAHERAVLMTLVNIIKDKYLPLAGMEEAELKIECEELPRNESEVPEDTLIDVALRLQNIAGNRELKMSRFKHVSMEVTDEEEWVAASDAQQGSSSEVAKATDEGTGESSPAHSQPATAKRGGQKSAHPRAKKPTRTKPKGA